MIARIDVPASTLIATHIRNNGGYADSFTTRVAGNIPLADFVGTFYTTPIFRMERALLRLAGHPSTDQQARDLAQGHRDDFAIWTRAVRDDHELMMHEASGATSSWFMVRPGPDETELFFGSAVRPVAPGSAKIPILFRTLIGFHNVYSRALLASAARHLKP